MANLHSQLDRSKPVYRVRYIESAGNRRAMRLLNAESEEQAKEFAKTFGDVLSFESVELLSNEYMDKMDEQAKNFRPLTEKEVARAKKYFDSKKPS